MPINKIIVNNETKLDLTADTVTPETLASGATAHDKTGAPIVGTMQGGGLSWVQVADTLPNPMYLLGDVNMDGSVTMDDARTLMGYLEGTVDLNTLQKVLANVDFNGKMDFDDVLYVGGIASGTYTPPFLYATAVEYADAKAGQDVKAIFEVVTSEGTMNAPTYAYVPWDGVIAIYSNVQIPAGAAGSIMILK